MAKISLWLWLVACHLFTLAEIVLCVGIRFVVRLRDLYSIQGFSVNSGFGFRQDFVRSGFPL